jgi:two-component system, NarL family, nitrate/nitrite response regulator NarL
MVARSQSTGTVIVGQRALFREGVAALLRHTPYKVIATAERSSELGNVRASTGSRTLVILGVDDETESASEVSKDVQTLRSLFSDSTIFVIAETRSPASFEQIVMAAPDGYVSNLKSRDVLLKLLDVVLLDQQVIVISRPTPASTAVDEGDSGKCANPRNSVAFDDRQCLSVRSVGAKDPQLSQREREILLRLAEGESNKQIARLCNITESTVKVHLKAILRKITVHNRTQAAIWAIAKGYHIMAVPDRAPKPMMHGIDDRSSIQGATSSHNGGPVALEVSVK